LDHQAEGYAERPARQ
jgi:hypothetical protein